ncbi:MAG: transcriptional regulator NrdR [Acetobacteraceae bacterium]|nr:transcriptional regulator NrdR [Acetobacteraceae bacterium]
MKCPFCGHPDSRVLDSRPTDEGTVIRRRRECPGCGRRFTTYEKAEQAPLLVVKRDGRREPFDRGKILAGLVKACEKRPVPLATLEALARDVEREVKGAFEQEVPSRQIGEQVMNRLRAVDEVAYVRFASVYRQFTDINGFMEELERLIRDRVGGGR